MAVGGPSSSLNSFLDDVPELHEICNHAKIADWHDLGIQLRLDIVDLDNIRNDSAMTNKLTSMYSLWLKRKGRNATRRVLLTALRTKHVGQNGVATSYEKELEKMVNT